MPLCFTSSGRPWGKGSRWGSLDGPYNPENKHSHRLQQKRRNRLVGKIKQLSLVSHSYSREKKIMECIPAKLLCVCACAPICTHHLCSHYRCVGVYACACACGGQRRAGDSNSSSRAASTHSSHWTFSSVLLHEDCLWFIIFIISSYSSVITLEYSFTLSGSNQNQKP